MSDEMEERVARRLCERRGLMPDVLYPTTNNPEVDSPPQAGWKFFILDARAAIEAMPDPTEAMTGAWFPADPPQWPPHW